MLSLCIFAYIASQHFKMYSMHLSQTIFLLNEAHLIMNHIASGHCYFMCNCCKAVWSFCLQNCAAVNMVDRWMILNLFFRVFNMSCELFNVRIAQNLTTEAYIVW